MYHRTVPVNSMLTYLFTTNNQIKLMQKLTKSKLFLLVKVTKVNKKERR